MLAVMVCSCANYALDGQKPAAMASIERIAVPMFVNDTLHPRAESLATSAVSDAIVRDGTFRMAGIDDADAVLEGTLRDINYTPLRGTRFDTLLAEEFQNNVTLEWVLRDARNPTRILARGQSNGMSQLFRDANLQMARNNALTLALENAADQLVSTMADGF